MDLVRRLLLSFSFTHQNLDCFLPFSLTVSPLPHSLPVASARAREATGVLHLVVWPLYKYTNIYFSPTPAKLLLKEVSRPPLHLTAALYHPRQQLQISLSSSPPTPFPPTSFPLTHPYTVVSDRQRLSYLAETFPVSSFTGGCPSGTVMA